MITLRDNIPVDEALALALFQRPGVRIIMGPDRAKEALVEPLSAYQLHKLPGPASWFDYDVMRVCDGWLPHFLALSVGAVCQRVTGRMLTQQEWEFLHNASAERRDAFLQDITKQKARERNRA